MKTKLNSKGLWWIPGGDKLFGTLTFDESDGGSLSVYGQFPDTSENEKERFYYPIILGETEDEKAFTLHSCNLETSYPYMKIMTKSKVNIDTIFEGHHFETEESIQFEKFSVVFSNIDRVVSPVSKSISFYKRAQIMEIPIKDICLIRIFVKTTVVKKSQAQELQLK